MVTSTSTAPPVTIALLARAMTYLVYAFVLVALVMLLFGFFGSSVLDLSLLFAMIVYGLAALLPNALIEWLTDRIAQMGHAR